MNPWKFNYHFLYVGLWVSRFLSKGYHPEGPTIFFKMVATTSGGLAATRWWSPPDNPTHPGPRAKAWASCHHLALIEVWRGLREDYTWALKSHFGRNSKRFGDGIFFEWGLCTFLEWLFSLHFWQPLWKKSYFRNGICFLKTSIYPRNGWLEDYILGRLAWGCKPCVNTRAQVRKMQWQHIVMDQDMPAQHFGRYGHSMMPVPGPSRRRFFWCEICLAAESWAYSLKIYLPPVFFCLYFCRVVFWCVWWQSDSYESFDMSVNEKWGHAQSLSECLAEALQRNLEACPRALLQGALQEGGTSACLGVTS